MSAETPATINEAVEWFVSSGSHDEATVRDLIERMMAAPNPFGGDTPVTATKAWSWIVEFGLLEKGGRRGWVTREGKVLSSGYGHHERLLNWLGVDTKDAEAAGWARIGAHNWQSTFKVTRAQKLRIEEAFLKVDSAAERSKPAWQAPSETATPRLR
jgi:hypothetical protein